MTQPKRPSQFKNVFMDSLAIAQPPRVVSSEEIEHQLKPLYNRLSLPEGRLELMTGIKERRLCAPGVKPSDLSVEAAENVFKKTSIDRSKIGCLIHTSVCRDFLEPATATVVHHKLGLSEDCQIFDLSNACLGFLNGMLQVANMIELGQIEAGLVVSGEDGRALVESTIEHLNSNTELTRKSIKGSFASLTIGSGGVAAILCSKELAAKNSEDVVKGPQFCGALTQSASQYHNLCQGGVSEDEATTSNVIMNTDSEAMLEAGIALASRCFMKSKEAFGLDHTNIDHFITHQVGSAHSKQLFHALELDESKDFKTYPFLGNMGSASIGSTLFLASEAGRLKKNDNVLLMGIGSGLVSMMVKLKW
ncbi:3-oxoacyl-ACP synthase III [bacterium]|nr:3-oxoacyl-ACP synthase III [bacterium]